MYCVLIKHFALSSFVSFSTFMKQNCWAFRLVLQSLYRQSSLAHTEFGSTSFRAALEGSRTSVPFGWSSPKAGGCCSAARTWSNTEWGRKSSGDVAAVADKCAVVGGLWHAAAHTAGCSLPESSRFVLVVFLAHKHANKVVSSFRRGGETSSRKESLGFSGARCAAPGLVCLVLLGGRSVLPRSLRPLLCFRQVSREGWSRV